MMKFLSNRSLDALLIILVAVTYAHPAYAQKSFAQAPASQRQLISIKVTGNKRFSEAAIVAASGLQIGSVVTEDDFKKAATRLGAYGILADISYTYSFSSIGTKLELQVTEAPKFVPARFEDFVWFSDEDLLKRIKERAPLFNGELPLSGRLADQVSDVLQTLLVENAIPGHVEYERSGKTDGPVDSLVYRVSDVLIQIRNVEFTGAGDAEASLKSAARRVSETEYSRSVLKALVQQQLTPVFQSRGYLKATFGEPQPKVVKRPSGESEGAGSIRNLTIVD